MLLVPESQGVLYMLSLKKVEQYKYELSQICPLNGFEDEYFQNIYAFEDSYAEFIGMIEGHVEEIKLEKKILEMEDELFQMLQYWNNKV